MSSSEEAKTAETTTSTTATTTATDAAASTEPACVRKRAAGKVTKIVKIGVMGDGTVGKTSFLLSYITHGFVGDYTPTVFDNFSAIEEVDDDVVNVILWDLAGQDEYSAVRNTCCRDCKYDILLVCFSTVLRDSFDNIKHKWLPEIRRFNTELPPIILVGTKTDLRSADNEDHITTKQGERLAKELKMQAYLECSAKDPDSVGKIIVDGIRILLAQDKKYRKATDKAAKKELKQEQKEAAAQAKAKQKEAAAQAKAAK